METLTPEEIREWEDRIDAIDAFEMAGLQRLAAFGHPVFRDDLPLYARFSARFKELGGMTPAISKRIGW